MEFATPTEEFGTPILTSGTPTEGFGTPNLASGTPILTSGTPTEGFGTPNWKKRRRWKGSLPSPDVSWG
jgi:hypothetical protein